MNKWQERAEKLARLAEDQRGNPEGDLAREKLTELINNHPEAANYQPIVDLAMRDISCQEFLWMKENCVSTDGRWEGRNIAEAIAHMCADYTRRYRMANIPRIPTELPQIEMVEAAPCA